MRDILYFADNFAHWRGGAHFAARLVAWQDGTLTGAFVYPSPLATMPPVIAPDVLSVVMESSCELERKALAAGPGFAAWAMGERVERSLWQVAEGYTPDVLAHLGNWHDALVLERGDGAWTSPAALGQLVLMSRLPTFLVAADAVLPERLGCVCLAWNGAAEGLRAIHAALPLLTQAERVVLLQGPLRASYAEGGWRPAFDIGAYFRRHDLSVDRHALEGSDDEAGAALLAACQAQGADLLVMGAYGHTRLREWVFGGATRHVLHHATLPVLMRH